MRRGADLEPLAPVFPDDASFSKKGFLTSWPPIAPPEETPAPAPAEEKSPLKSTWAAVVQREPPAVAVAQTTVVKDDEKLPAKDDDATDAEKTVVEEKKVSSLEENAADANADEKEKKTPPNRSERNNEPVSDNNNDSRPEPVVTESSASSTNGLADNDDAANAEDNADDNADDDNADDNADDAEGDDDADDDDDDESAAKVAVSEEKKKRLPSEKGDKRSSLPARGRRNGRSEKRRDSGATTYELRDEDPSRRARTMFLGNVTGFRDNKSAEASVRSFFDREECEGILEVFAIVARAVAYVEFQTPDHFAKALEKSEGKRLSDKSPKLRIDTARVLPRIMLNLPPGTDLGHKDMNKKNAEINAAEKN